MVSYQFFQFNALNKDVVLTIAVLYIAFTIIYCNKKIFITKYKNKTLKSYRCLFIWILISSLICPYIFWQQNILLNFRISIEVLTYTYLFLLLKSNINEKSLIKLINFYFILHITLKIIGIIYAPRIIFGFSTDSELDNSRGLVRIYVSGGGFAILSFFMNLNYYKDSRSMKYLIMALLAYTAIILSVTRQTIIISTLLGIIYFMGSQRQKLIRISVILLIFYALANFIMDTDLPIVKNLVEMSQQQIENNNSGEEDIRIQETRFFLFDFNKSIPQTIFGNGLPHAYSNYGKEIMKLSAQNSLYANDVGYVFIYLSFGIIGIILFAWLFYNMIRLPTNGQLTWCKLYLWYLLLSNIASQAIYNSGITISIAAYYLIINANDLNKGNNENTHLC